MEFEVHLVLLEHSSALAVLAVPAVLAVLVASVAVEIVVSIVAELNSKEVEVVEDSLLIDYSSFVIVVVVEV